MKHYQTPDGRVFAFELDGSQDNLITPDMEKIEDEDLPTVLQSLLKEPPIPDVVSMSQARLALLQAGLLTSVNVAVAQAGEAAKIKWEYSKEVRRDDPLFAVLSKELELSDSQLDELFIAASRL